MNVTIGGKMCRRTGCRKDMGRVLICEGIVLCECTVLLKNIHIENKAINDIQSKKIVEKQNK